MNPILYNSAETSFDSNGIGILSEALSCQVVAELNGQYELEMKYPANGKHFKELTPRCIIMAKPDPVADPQPFRIYRETSPLSGMVTVFARHIAYDTKGIPVSPFSAKGITLALQGIKANAATDCPFEFWTDKTANTEMTVAEPTAIWTLLGGSKGSVLDMFGGEYEFDRYTIKLHNRRGADRGVSIRYGKNLTSLEQDANCANCYTGVYPYWTDSEGTLVQLPEKIVNAPGEYDHTKILPISFSDDWDEAPSVDQLRQRAEKYVLDNDIGTPEVSWEVSSVQLEQSEEYKQTAILERIILGDTVSVYFPKMNISAEARVVATRYDVLKERYISTTLGRVKSNLADTIAKAQQDIAEKPSATWFESMATQMGKRISGAKGGCVRWLDTNDDGMPDELFIADNPDPTLALKVWRYNYEGWAASKHGYNGPFEMVGTLDDGLLANAITAGTLNAGIIKAGILKSPNSDAFFIDLDTGECVMKSESVVVGDVSLDEKLSNTDQKASNLASDVSDALNTIAATNEITGKMKSELVSLGGQITANYSALLTKINNNQESTEAYITDTRGFIRQGFIDYDAAGVPIIGIAIGQNLRSTTVTVDGQTLEQLDSAQSCAFYTADKVSFRIGGNEVAYVSNRKLYILDAQVTGSLTIGDWLFSHGDAGLVVRYTGG